MRESFLFYLISVLYELNRIMFIILTQPEYSIEILPASWYSSVSLLVLPAMLVILMAAQENNFAKKIYKNIYLVVKLLSAAGLMKYVSESIILSFSVGQMNDFYSLKRSCLLMIFSLIDVIICIFLFFRGRTKNTSDEDRLAENLCGGENELCK